MPHVRRGLGIEVSLSETRQKQIEEQSNILKYPIIYSIFPIDSRWFALTHRILVSLLVFYTTPWGVQRRCYLASHGQIWDWCPLWLLKCFCLWNVHAASFLNKKSEWQLVLSAFKFDVSSCVDACSWFMKAMLHHFPAWYPTKDACNLHMSRWYSRLVHLESKSC